MTIANEKKPSRINPKRFAIIIAGILYLLLTAYMTFNSVLLYQGTLPKVELTTPEKRSFLYTFKKEARVEDGMVIAEVDSREELFIADVFIKGLPAKITTPAGEIKGELSSVEVIDNYLGVLTVKPAEEIPADAEEITLEITCDNTREFSNVLPREAVANIGAYNEAYIYDVVKETGPWSDRYIIMEKAVIAWPAEGSDYLMLVGNIEYNFPIAKKVSPDFYSGMEVQIAG